ncbi:hypothetical protein N7488_005688 [Penicillium malachiteum]|nr:hypothetical protein N7488_005688 [Penicillium malachiteum]
MSLLSANAARWIWENLGEDLQRQIECDTGPIRRGYADTLHDEIVKQMDGEGPLADMDRVNKLWNMTADDFP